MHLQLSDYDLHEELLFMGDVEEILDGGYEKRRKSTKFKQERIFPNHKKGRSYKRKKQHH